jgi:hypothetical protein
VSDIRQPEWPHTGRDDDDNEYDLDQVLAEFDRWHPIAVESLAAAEECTCECGHDGLPEPWHLSPCPIAVRRFERRATAERIEHEITRFGDSVRVFLRADGTRREEPREDA